MAAHIGNEPRGVQAELPGVFEEIPAGERALVGQQQVVHGPEGALRRGRLGGFGRELRVRVHVVQRQVPPHVPDVAEVSQQLTYDGLGEAAVGALEVGVFHQGDRGVPGPRT